MTYFAMTRASLPDPRGAIVYHPDIRVRRAAFLSELAQSARMMYYEDRFMDCSAARLREALDTYINEYCMYWEEPLIWC